MAEADHLPLFREALSEVPRRGRAPGETPGQAGTPVETGSQPPRAVTRSIPDFLDSLASTPDEVREILARVTGIFRERGLSEADLAAAEVALAEILNNIVEHAYGGADDGLISIHISRSSDALTIILEDEGAPMPDLALPRPGVRNLKVDFADLPEGGFGWHLIRELTCDLRYSRTGRRNRLEFRIMTGKQG